MNESSWELEKIRDYSEREFNVFEDIWLSVAHMTIKELKLIILKTKDDLKTYEDELKRRVSHENYGKEKS